MAGQFSPLKRNSIALVVKGGKARAMLHGMIKMLSQKYRGYVDDDLNVMETTLIFN